MRRARKRSRADAAIGILPGRNIWSEGIESRSEIRGPDQRAGYENLRRAAAQYRTPSFTRSLSQIISSFGGFFAACAAMYALWDVSYAITLALSPLAGGFLVRVFIIQHDCGHRAFFRSARANNILGFVCSLLTLTPYTAWRRQHAAHHGIWNDLDRRQSGVDLYANCLTVAEYHALNGRQRFWHRFTRHPLFANLILPPFVFLLFYRFPIDMPKSWRVERRLVHLTSLIIFAGLASLGLLLGYAHVAVVQFSAMAFTAIIGVWLFSVQHRGEQTEWSRHDTWDATRAALQSSNFLRLPRILQWFTGNIGFHHVHHLNSQIPNYRLQECHEAIAELHNVRPMSLREGFTAMRMTL